ARIAQGIFPTIAKIDLALFGFGDQWRFLLFKRFAAGHMTANLEIAQRRAGDARNLHCYRILERNQRAQILPRNMTDGSPAIATRWPSRVDKTPWADLDATGVVTNHCINTESSCIGSGHQINQRL